MWGALAFRNIVFIIYRIRSPWSTLLLLLGDGDEAIDVLMTAKMYIPNEFTLYFNLGNMLGQKDKFQVRLFR